MIVETGENGDDAMELTLGMLEIQRDGRYNSGGTAAGVKNLRRQYARASGGESTGPGEKRKMRQANTKASRKKAKVMGMGMGEGRSVGVSRRVERRVVWCLRDFKGWHW